MKLLVTGGAGFIGSNFIRYILQNSPQDSIINLDALTYAGNQDNLQEFEGKSNYTFIHGDICNRELVHSIFQQGIDVVINFAAESHVDRSITNPDIFVKTNILGTQVLLDAAKEFNIKKFVQISTDEVYGTLGPSGFFTEDSPLLPNSPYSASKAGADLLVRSYHETYGLPVNITRCSNNYGPYQFPEKLIPFMIINALQNKTLPIYGDGLNIRDWLHVEDHSRAIDLVMRNGIPGEVYNIGANNEWNNIEIVTFILNELGKPEAPIEYVQDRLGHDKRYAIDATKIRRELAWEPIFEFNLGLKETIQWYIRNEHWWTNLISRQK